MKLCRTTSAHQIVARNQHPARATQNLDMFQSPLGRFPGFKCFNLFPPPMAHRSHAARPKGSLVRCFSLRKVIMFLHEVRQLLHTLVKDLPSWLKWKTLENDGGPNGTEQYCRSFLCCIFPLSHHFGWQTCLGHAHPISTLWQTWPLLAQTEPERRLHPSATTKAAPITIKQLRRNIGPVHAIVSIASAVSRIQ